MNKNQLFGFVLGVVVISALISSCGGQQEDKHRGYLRLRLAEDPTTLDPAQVVDVPGGALTAKLFNGLVRFDPDGNVVNDLAESWEVEPDMRTYKFKLRDGARFSNGSEVEAEDVVFSLTRLLDPEINSPRSWLLEQVKGADEFSRGEAVSVSGLRATDSRSVEIELEEPFSLFINLLAMPNAAILPRQVVRAKGRKFSESPVGSGPFFLETWDHGNDLLLSRTDNYFRGPVSLAGVHYRIIPEDMTATLEFEQGNLDMIEVPRAEFKKYTTTSPFKENIISRGGLNTYYVGFNCTRPPFDNPMVRQALNWGIDRNLICEKLLESRAEPAMGPVPPSLLKDPDLAGYGYSPRKAARMLEISGIKLPLRVELLVSSDRENVSVAEVLQDYWKKLGVEVQIVQREWSAFKQQINEGDFDLFYLSWWGDYPSAENFLYPTFYSDNRGPGGNRSRFSDRGVDLLLKAARRRPDRKGETKLYRKAQREVVKLAPWVFLWHKKQYLAVSPMVKNYFIPLLYSSENLESVKLERGS